MSTLTPFSYGHSQLGAGRFTAPPASGRPLPSASVRAFKKQPTLRPLIPPGASTSLNVPPASWSSVVSSTTGPLTPRTGSPKMTTPRTRQLSQTLGGQPKAPFQPSLSARPHGMPRPPLSGSSGSGWAATVPTGSARLASAAPPPPVTSVAHPVPGRFTVPSAGMSTKGMWGKRSPSLRLFKKPALPRSPLSHGRRPLLPQTDQQQQASSAILESSSEEDEMIHVPLEEQEPPALKPTPKDTQEVPKDDDELIVVTPEQLSPKREERPRLDEAEDVVRPYSERDRLDVWYPFVDRGTMFAPFFPVRRYPQLHAGKSWLCRHVPISSPLSAFARTTLPMRSRAYYGAARRSGHASVHVLASSPVEAPALAYRYDRMGVMRSSPPTTSDRSTRLVQRERESESIDGIVGTESVQMQRTVRDLDAVMTVQSHELAVMADTINELTQKIEQQSGDLRRAVGQKQQLAAELAALRHAQSLTDRRSLDAMLRQAEQRMGTALIAKRLRQSGGQPSFFEAMDQQEPPEFPSEEPRVAVLRTSGTADRKHARREQRRKKRRHETIERQRREQEGSRGDTHGEGFRQRTVSRKIESPASLQQQRLGSQVSLPPTGLTQPYDASLPLDLQNILVRQPEETQKPAVMVVLENNVDGQGKLEVADVKQIQDENSQLHKIVASLEKRLSALYSELREREMERIARAQDAERLTAVKQERDAALAAHEHHVKTIERLERRIRGLQKALNELEDAAGVQAPLLSEGSESDEEVSSLHPPPRILTTAAGDTLTPRRYTFARTIRRGSSEVSKEGGAGSPRVELAPPREPQSPQRVPRGPKRGLSDLDQQRKSPPKEKPRLPKLLPSVPGHSKPGGPKQLPVPSLKGQSPSSDGATDLPQESSSGGGPLVPATPQPVVAAQLSDAWQARFEKLMEERAQAVAVSQTQAQHLDALRQQLNTEQQIRREAETRFEEIRQRHADRIQEQAQVIAKAAQEIEMLRKKVARAEEADRLQQLLETTKSARDDAEAKAEALGSRLMEATQEFRRRLEEGRRAFEAVLVDRDKAARARDELKTELQRVTGDLSTTTDLLQKAEKTILDLSPENRDLFAEALRQRAASTDEQLKRMHAQIQDLQTQRDKAEALRDTARDDLRAARKKLESLEGLFTTVNAELQQKAEQLGEERADRLMRERLFKETELRNQFLVKCLEEYEATIREKNRKIDEILENRAKFKEALQVVGQNYAVLQEKYQEMEQQLHGAKNNILKLQRVIEKALAEKEAMQTEMAAVASEKDEVQEKLNRADLILIRRGAELEELTTRLEKKTTQLMELTQENAELHARLDGLSSDHDELQRRASFHEEKASSTKRLIQMSNKDRDGLSNELRELRAELDATSAELLNTSHELERLRVDARHAMAQSATMEKDLATTMKENALLTEELRRVTLEKAIIMQKLEAKEKTEKVLMREAAASRTREIAVSGGLQEFESQLAAALAEKDRVIQTLSDELKSTKQHVEESQTLAVHDTESDPYVSSSPPRACQAATSKESASSGSSENSKRTGRRRSSSLSLHQTVTGPPTKEASELRKAISKVEAMLRGNQVTERLACRPMGFSDLTAETVARAAMPSESPTTSQQQERGSVDNTSFQTAPNAPRPASVHVVVPPSSSFEPYTVQPPLTLKPSPTLPSPRLVSTATATPHADTMISSFGPQHAISQTTISPPITPSTKAYRVHAQFKLGSTPPEPCGYGFGKETSSCCRSNHHAALTSTWWCPCHTAHLCGPMS